MKSLEGKKLVYICLWDSELTVGSDSPITINDQFLSKENSEINEIGRDSFNQNVESSNSFKQSHHFIFSKLDDSTNYKDLYNEADEMQGDVPIKTIFSSKSSLYNFSMSLFGHHTDMTDTVILVRPDGHIANYTNYKDAHLLQNVMYT